MVNHASLRVLIGPVLRNRNGLGKISGEIPCMCPCATLVNDDIEHRCLSKSSKSLKVQGGGRCWCDRLYGCAHSIIVAICAKFFDPGPRASKQIGLLVMGTGEFGVAGGLIFLSRMADA